MTIDRAKFFAGYRKRIGSLKQDHVRALLVFLTEIENQTIVTAPSQLAYVFATVYHEAAHTWLPIREFASGKKYEGRADLGNVEAGDGVRYAGRGFVQLTGRTNFEKMTKLWNAHHPDEQVDFVANPDLQLETRYSIFTLLYGMAHGVFTGKKLDDYIVPSLHIERFVDARRIINGFDRASLIGGYADDFHIILMDAIVR